MKKNLFYLFALVCAMSLFTACSDDDDDVIDSPVVGEWTLQPLEVGDNATILSSPIQLAVEPGDETIALFMNLGQQVLGQMLPEMLKKVEFLDNGKISATYVEDGVTKTDDTHASFAKVSDSQIKVYLHLDEFKNEEMYQPFASLIAEGVPMNFAVNGNKMTILIEQSYLQNKVLPVVDALISNLNTEDMDETLVGILGLWSTVFKPAMVNATKLEVGLNLQK